MDGLRVGLLALGIALDVGGIVLVASPDLFPAVGAAWAWLLGRGRVVVTRARRLVGRPAHRVVTLSAAVEGSAALSMSVVLGISPALTLEEKVAKLIERETQTQVRLNALDDRVAAEAETRQAAIENSRREVEERMTVQMHDLLDTHKRKRLIGVGLLIAASICTTAANFA